MLGTNVYNVIAYNLTRRNLRDLIMVFSLGSALFLDTSSTCVYISFASLVLGCLIHLVSKGTLIRNTVLCTEGIYGLVRHPYYLANCLIDWSFCLLSGNLLLVLAYPFLFFYAYGPTMRKEEELLFNQHGDSFTRSTLEIPQVFPNINTVKNIGMVFKGFSLKRITPKECSRIVKFWAAGFLLVLIHKIKVDIVGGLRHIVFPTTQDFDEFLIALSMTVFYIVSTIALAMSDRHRSMLVREVSNHNVKDSLSNHDHS